jgi:hypothetical protein
MMKRATAALIPSLLLLCAAPAAYADAYDCFPACREPAAAPAKAAINLCEHRAVREVARIERDLKPVKQIYDIATNPTGFAIKQVNDHVVHIPPWVGYAMDPKGAIRAKVMDRARGELRKQVGLQNECAAEAGGEEAIDDFQRLLPYGDA